MPESSNEPSAPGDGGSSSAARDRRLVVIVEAFLRQVRNGGSLDPEPFLLASHELREELEPLLHGVLRLEQIADSLDSGSGAPRATTHDSKLDERS